MRGKSETEMLGEAGVYTVLRWQNRTFLLCEKRMQLYVAQLAEVCVVCE